MATHEEQGNPCRGLVIAAGLCIPAYAIFSAGVWLAVRRFTPWPLSYWQVLGIVLTMATVAGAIIALVGLRKKGSIS